MSASVEHHHAGLPGDGLLAAFLAAAPAKIVVSAPGGRSVLASARPAELFGYAAGDPVGVQLDALGDGTTRALDVYASQLTRCGERLGVRVVRDVSAGHHEELFGAVLESAPDGIVVVDRDAPVRVVNDQAERHFGSSREEFLGKPIEVRVPERCRAARLGARDACLAHPEARPMGSPTSLLTGRREDGSGFPRVQIGFEPGGRP